MSSGLGGSPFICWPQGFGLVLFELIPGPPWNAMRPRGVEVFLEVRRSPAGSGWRGSDSGARVVRRLTNRCFLPASTGTHGAVGMAKRVGGCLPGVEALPWAHDFMHGAMVASEHGSRGLASVSSPDFRGGSCGSACQYTVVLPVFNERENLEPLLEELEPVLSSLGGGYEVIAVDDGSTDGSWEELQRLQRRWPWLRVVRHRFNAGQSAAFLTGFARARGEVVITLDADGQNDPRDIPSMLARLRGAVAAVCGVRQKRQDPWIRRVSSRVANGFRNRVTGDRVADAGCALRVMRRSALGELPPFNGLHRFLPSVLRFQGYEVLEVPVGHRPRTRGHSKYGIGNRLWRGLVDCLAMRWYRARALRADRVEREEPGPGGARESDPCSTVQ